MCKSIRSEQVDPLDQRRQQNSDPGRLQCRPNRREFGGLPEEIALRGSLQPEWLGRLDQAGGVPEQLPDSLGNELLDLGSRHAHPIRRYRPRTGDQRLGDIVTITPAVLDRMAWRHAVAVGIEQQACQQAWTARADTGAALDRIRRELGLRGLPEFGIDDGLMLSRVMLVLMDDLAAIDPVLQHQIE